MPTSAQLNSALPPHPPASHLYDTPSYSVIILMPLLPCPRRQSSLRKALSSTRQPRAISRRSLHSIFRAANPRFQPSLPTAIGSVDLAQFLSVPGDQWSVTPTKLWGSPAAGRTDYPRNSYYIKLNTIQNNPNEITHMTFTSSSQSDYFIPDM
jgi:hypothetical protein